MKYMLDTNIVSFMLRGAPKVLSKSVFRMGQWQVSAIVAGELAVLLQKTKNPVIEEGLFRFLAETPIAPFGGAAAKEFGAIIATTEASGRRIPKIDAFIAAHALAEGAILVTNNTKDFQNIEGLVIEDWSQ